LIRLKDENIKMGKKLSISTGERKNIELSLSRIAKAGGLEGFSFFADFSPTTWAKARRGERDG